MSNVQNFGTSCLTLVRIELKIAFSCSLQTEMSLKSVVTPVGEFAELHIVGGGGGGVKQMMGAISFNVKSWCEGLAFRGGD